MNEAKASLHTQICQLYGLFHEEIRLSAEGAVTLVFHGCDNDARDLEAISEARIWFAKLFEAWPYWSFFASRIDQTVPLVLTPLLPGENVAGVL